MTWKKNKEGVYEQRCPHCEGSGRLTLFADGKWSCGCPGEHMDNIDHPSNTRGELVGHRLERCRKCGLVWLCYHQTSEDSLDIPGPVCLGNVIPDDDWRPEENK